MLGRRQAQATMLAFIDLEERVPRGHPLRAIKPFADGRCRTCRRCSTRCTRGWSAVDPARAAAEGVAADRAVLRAQRAGVLRGARL